MKNSSRNIILTLTLIGLCFSFGSLNAQDKDKKRKRDRWVRVEPVPPIPPVPPVISVPSVPSVPAVPSVHVPIVPIVPIEPIVPIAPIAPIEPIAPLIDWYDSFESSSRYFNRQSGLYIESSGKVRLTGNRDAIRSISEDGFLMIKERKGKSGREIFIEQDENGQLVYDFYKKGRRLPMEGEGQEWLKQIWKELVKNLK